MRFGYSKELKEITADEAVLRDLNDIGNSSIILADIVCILNGEIVMVPAVAG